MKVLHPYFFYQLKFIMTKANTQKLITQVKEKVLLWDEVSTGIHTMGGVEFLFREKEIGHIHWNGDLDIKFGKRLTEELLIQSIVQQHKFVPSVAITYPLLSNENIPFAFLLLRLSYLIQQKKVASNKDLISHQIETELEAIKLYK